MSGGDAAPPAGQAAFGGDAASDERPRPAVRTRFAPSPTGRLHLGNLRVAAFNWLFARKHGGAFVLRIEDTDPERNVPGSEALVCDDLRWLGLDWDEGPEVGGTHAPYRQSERGEVYRRTAEALLARGTAYRCWCTEAELEEGRERVSGGDVLRYSGRCRRLSAEERARNAREGRPSVVRFAVPEGDGAIDVDDAVRGHVSFPRADVTDFVILRSDGTATYNFAVVADDVDMEITHVIRHVGHLSNTPRQALLFDALGRPRPVFAHLPTVLAPEGGKLSKRSGTAGADVLRAQGVHPDGVLNYLSLLGWSSEDEREVLTRDELIRRISLERVGRSDTTFDPEKLRWLSGQHIAMQPVEQVVEGVRPFVDVGRYPLHGDALRTAIETIRTRLSAYGEVGEHLRFFFPPAGALADAQAEVRGDAAARRVVEAVAKRLAATQTWTPEVLSAAVRETGKELGVRGPALFHPVRKAVTADESGPDLGGILAALGKDEVLSRLRSALGG
jgi:nondiscriminating glutamyl-tRNA synthetase